MGYISDIQISDALLPYGFTPNESQASAIRSYISLLLRWNQRISLTTVTEVPEILRFHFGECLFALSVVKINHGRLADVGSGAGFPGLPIKIAVPELKLTLIESNARKSTYLSEVVRSLELHDVEVSNRRMEGKAATSAGFDFITARALGQHEDLLAWSRIQLSPAGEIILWLGEKDASRLSRISGWTWQPPQLIPATEGRLILVGSPKN